MLYTVSQSRNLSVARGAIVIYGQEIGITLEEISKILKRSASALSSLKRRLHLKPNAQIYAKMEMLKIKANELADLQA